MRLLSCLLLSLSFLCSSSSFASYLTSTEYCKLKVKNKLFEQLEALKKELPFEFVSEEDQSLPFHKRYHDEASRDLIETLQLNLYSLPIKESYDLYVTIKNHITNKNYKKTNFLITIAGTSFYSNYNERTNSVFTVKVKSAELIRQEIAFKKYIEKTLENNDLALDFYPQLSKEERAEISVEEIDLYPHRVEVFEFHPSEINSGSDQA